MVAQPDEFHAQNEERYDQLISLIENSQGRLAPIIVACDDMPLRDRLIARYEIEARRSKIRPYRIVLGQEPSLRAALDTLTQQEAHLQRGGEAVFTVTGAELLLRVTLNSQDEQSELDKFFGYLQWTREGLQSFRYPIVLWVTHRILKELSRRAPDFWSWRKAVLRFQEESPLLSQVPITVAPASPNAKIQEGEQLPPLKDLQTEIAALTARDPDSPNLATLYYLLGRVYGHRIETGIAQNLAKEQQFAVTAHQEAIRRYQVQSDQLGEMRSLQSLSSFLDNQSRYAEAIPYLQNSFKIAQKLKDLLWQGSALRMLGSLHRRLGEYQQAIDFEKQALEIYREISDQWGEAACLMSLGSVYGNLKQYHQELICQQRALEIQREIRDRTGEGATLGNIGNAYTNLGEPARAIEFYQQALEVQREVGNRMFESNTLTGLGDAYHRLERYDQAIDFYKQALNLKRAIGDLYGEAATLFNWARTLKKLGDSWQAVQYYQQAKEIYQSLDLSHKVEECDAAIYALNRTIPVQQPIQAPQIESTDHKVARRRGKVPLWAYGLVGVAIALLIWWLKR
jgi:tetratricopeptide (TPR) repeat protein